MDKTNCFLGIMMGIIGLTMLLAAESIVKIIVIVLGSTALVNGIFVLVSIAPLSCEKCFRIECYARTGISVIIGLLCIILPLSMASFVWQIFIYIFAVYALVSAVLEIAIAYALYSEGFPVKKQVIEIVATIALAVILFMLPSSFGFTIIRIGGAIILAAGIVTLLIAYKNRDIIIEPDNVE